MDDQNIPQANLRAIQDDIYRWTSRNFGPNSPISGDLVGLLTLTKYVGDAAHSILKLSQGIRGTPAEHLGNLKIALRELQDAAEHFNTAPLAADNLDWPVNVSAGLGAIEEVGELAAAMLDLHTGTPGARDAFEDSIGDILVYLLDLCARNKVSATDILNKTWAAVRQRDWVKNRQTGA